jgi:hypothetical protein
MKTQRNYWPLGITLTLLLFFLGTIGLVVLASAQRVDLVTPNYYEDEIRFQKQIERVEHASHLESAATADYDPVAEHITISLPLHSTPGQVQGQIQLYRPSDAELDQNYNLSLNTNGLQVIDASRLREGQWLVKVAWSVGGEDYYFDQKIIVGVAKS